MAKLAERRPLHRIAFCRLACKRHTSYIFFLEDQGSLPNEESGMDDILRGI